MTENTERQISGKPFVGLKEKQDVKIIFQTDP